MKNTEINISVGNPRNSPKNILEYISLEDNQELLPDEHIFSTLYYVSFSRSLRSLEGISDASLRSKYQAQNNWLKEKIPESEYVHIVNLDKLKDKVEACKDLQSCDGFFFTGEFSQPCFLIEFKKVNLDELLCFLEIRGNNPDQIINKVRHTIELFRNVSFSAENEMENLIRRTHVMVVYDGKNNVASFGSVLRGQPGKTPVMANEKGRQTRASRQVYGKRTEISGPSAHFARKVQELNFRGVKKSEVPGLAYPDDETRFASIMSVSDFAKVTRSRFVTWDWKEIGVARTAT